MPVGCKARNGIKYNPPDFSISYLFPNSIRSQ